MSTRTEVQPNMSQVAIEGGIMLETLGSEYCLANLNYRRAALSSQTLQVLHHPGRRAHMQNTTSCALLMLRKG